MIFGLMFPILLLAMAVYVLIGAIKGSGRLFSMENFKEESKDKAKKIMRALYFALAAIMLLMALTNALNSVLYSEKVTYYKITDAYRDAFPDLIAENGQLLKTNSDGTFEKDSDGNPVEQTDANGNKEAYNINNDRMDATVCVNGFIQNAYNIYHTDTTKFPQTSAGMFSCTGGSVDYAKYYTATDLLDAEGNPVYNGSGDTHVAYVTSMFGRVRSDANDGSFASKLYGACSRTLLTVLNYVFLGLAVLGVVALFVISSKFTDKEKLKKAREQQVRPSMPSDAFNFDDEPKQNSMKENK